MPYFASKFYNGFKTSVASLGTISSTAMIIYGAVTSGAGIYIVGGSIFLAESLFLLFDSSKVLADIKKEIDRLNTLLNVITEETSRLKQNVDDLTHVKTDIVAENQELQKTIAETNKQIEYQDQQITKLKLLYDDAKKLLVNLASAGDMFNEFSHVIDTSVIKLDDTKADLDQTAGTLKKLVERLGQEKFQDMDLNQDGVLTPLEFSQALQL